METDLCSVLPNCYMHHTMGPPWPHSRSAAPVLPVTPRGMLLTAISIWLHSSFAFKLKALDLVHICNLPADQSSLGKDKFFCIWFLSQEIPGGNVGIWMKWTNKDTSVNWKVSAVSLSKTSVDEYYCGSYSLSDLFSLIMVLGLFFQN